MYKNLMTYKFFDRSFSCYKGANTQTVQQLHVFCLLSSDHEVKEKNKKIENSSWLSKKINDLLMTWPYFSLNSDLECRLTQCGCNPITEQSNTW